MEVDSAALPLILKSLWLSAKWAGIARVKSLKRGIGQGEEVFAEVLFLRDRVAQLETELLLARSRIEQNGQKPCYTQKERLLVLWLSGILSDSKKAGQEMSERRSIHALSVAEKGGR